MSGMTDCVSLQRLSRALSLGWLGSRRGSLEFARSRPLCVSERRRPLMTVSQVVAPLASCRVGAEDREARCLLQLRRRCRRPGEDSDGYPDDEVDPLTLLTRDEAEGREGSNQRVGGHQTEDKGQEHSGAGRGRRRAGSFDEEQGLRAGLTPIPWMMPIEKAVRRLY